MINIFCNLRHNAKVLKNSSTIVMVANKVWNYIGSCAFRTTKFSCSDFNLLCNTRNRWSIHHREHLEAQVNGYFDLNQLFYRTCCRSERFEMNHTQEKMPFWGATTHFSSLPNRIRTASEPHPNRIRTAAVWMRFGSMWIESYSVTSSCYKIFLTKQLFQIYPMLMHLFNFFNKLQSWLIICTMHYVVSVHWL